MRPVLHNHMFMTVLHICLHIILCVICVSRIRSTAYAKMTSDLWNRSTVKTQMALAFDVGFVKNTTISPAFIAMSFDGI